MPSNWICKTIIDTGGNNGRSFKLMHIDSGLTTGKEDGSILVWKREGLQA